MTLPNQITIFRILLIPVFVGLLLYYRESFRSGVDGEFFRWAALGIFILASLSDGLDGWIARHFNLRSRLGAILDPIADKALLVTALITLTCVQMDNMPRLPIWFVVLVLGRDGILVAGFVFLHLFTRNIHVKPHWTGKVSTAFQMVVISLVLLKTDPEWIFFLVVLAGLFTVVSMVIYMVRGTRALASSGYGEPGL